MDTAMQINNFNVKIGVVLVGTIRRKAANFFSVGAIFFADTVNGYANNLFLLFSKYEERTESMKDLPVLNYIPAQVFGLRITAILIFSITVT
jgi:hypothetical protein